MSKVKAFLKLARPHQYVKNGFIFLPLFFGHKMHDYKSLLVTSLAFIVFCLAASSVYVINDINDIQEDRHHPIKKYRPLAAGILNKSEARIFYLVLLTFSIIISLIFIKPLFLLLLGSYLLLNLTYTYKLKHVAIIDVVCISVGFVLRVFAGGLAANIWPTHWLILMTFLLALFLSFAKRRDEIQISSSGITIRQCLTNYNLEFASLSMVIMASVLIVCYVLYTVSPEVTYKHGTTNLYLTTFWVIIGLLRYMQITVVENRSGDPTSIIIKDGFLRAVVLLWIIHYVILLYVVGA